MVLWGQEARGQKTRTGQSLDKSLKKTIPINTKPLQARDRERKVARLGDQSM